MIKRKKSTTCIIALKNTKGKILIAADRRASFDWSKHVTMNKPKVRKNNGYIIAGTGDGALCSLFVDAFTPPDYDGEDLDIFMHHKFYKSVVRTLIGHDMVDAHKVLKIPPETYCGLVIALNGHVYTVDIFNPDENGALPYGVVAIDEVPTPYTTGCGGEHAKGAIDAMILQGVKDTRLIAKTAIEVAAMNSPGCDAVCDLIIES
jgi:hypothetical protein